MIHKRLRGTGVAMVTPFIEDSSIDFNALRKLTEHIVKGGVEFLVVMGTTGETQTNPKIFRIFEATRGAAEASVR